MGNVIGINLPEPQPIELVLPWGPILRGLRWGTGPDVALFLHEPGADIDAWGALPARLARSIELEAIAVDLPGHGLSDDPWEPERVPETVRLLTVNHASQGRRFVIAAGSIAFSTLILAADFELAGLVCLSPSIPPTPALSLSRSPLVPKLLIAGSMATNDLAVARQLAFAAGGWVVVTSVPVARRGTNLIAAKWTDRLTEEITAFLRDCQRRPPPIPSVKTSQEIVNAS